MASRFISAFLDLKPDPGAVVGARRSTMLSVAGRKPA